MTVQHTIREQFFLVGLGIALVHCVEPLDTTPPPHPELSLGQEIYLEVCNRIAHADDPYDVSGAKTRSTCLLGKEPPATSGPRLHTLHAYRDVLVRTLDQVLVHDDPELASDMRTLLSAMLPLYDNQTIQHATRAASDALTDIAVSEAALKALEKIGTREGYRPFRLGLGLLRPFFAYPELAGMTDEMLSLVQVDAPAWQPWQQMLTALRLSLENVGDSLDLDAESLEIFRELLLKERAELSGTQPRYLVRRDPRGLAQPRRDEFNTIIAPFVDATMDGLADVDELGRFVDATGAVLHVPEPFELARPRSSLFSGQVNRDSYGRPLTDQGQLYYEYINTSTTLLAAGLKETHSLVNSEADALFDLLEPLVALLGPHRLRTHVFTDGTAFTFDGYDVDRSPLLDVTHTLGLLADRPIVYWALRFAEALLQNKEHEIAGVLQVASSTLEWLGEPPYKDLTLEPHSELAEDLIHFATRLARVPGLMEGVLKALQHPDSRAMGNLFATIMTYKDPLHLNPDDTNLPAIISFETPVNRQQPDTWDNRSILQRFLHLVHDTNGLRMCNKPEAVLDLGIATYPLSGSYAECELFEIDNLAVFYIRSMIGRAEIEFKDPLVNVLSELDFLLQQMSGITGFTKTPTPQAINRMVFAPRNNFLQNIINPPITRDGLLVEEVHPHTIFITEWEGFIDGLAPLMTAFSDAGREDLFADLMSILHLHWSTPATNTTQAGVEWMPLYAKQSGLVRMEPMMQRLLHSSDEDAVNYLADLLHAVYSTSVEGVPGEAVLVDLVRHLFLPEWSPEITLRSGESSIVLEDGFSTVSPISPAWVLYDAARNMSALLSGSNISGSLTNVAQHFMSVRTDALGRRELQNRRLHAIALVLLQFACDRLEARHLDGSISEWSEQITPNVRELLSSPLPSTALRFAEVLMEHPPARQHIMKFTGYFMDELSPNDAFAAMLASLTDLLQLLDTLDDVKPLLEAVAPSINAQQGVVQRSVTLMQRANAVDQNNALFRLLANMVTPRTAENEQSALEVIWHVASEVNRADPGSGGPLTSQDYAHIFTVVQAFLNDDIRGLERLYTLITHR